jgi:hypothetical protein
MSFSDRVRSMGTVEVTGGPQVIANKNQLLVHRKPGVHPDPDDVKRSLEAKNIGWEPITTLLAGLDKSYAMEEDIEILHVHLDDDWRDIFELTRELRDELDPVAGQGRGRSVSPNHILVPANEDHSCPFGPPWATTDAVDLELATEKIRQVTIIDSGYQWDNAWDQENPLNAYAGAVGLAQAETLADPGGWAAGVTDVPDANQPGTLGALAGHANFIAGVIAQNCQNAKMFVWNHNGAFPEAGDDLPTEADIVRSLCACALDHPETDVINLGFAFAAFDDVVSYAWDIGFAYIRKLMTEAVVVSPAGNQHSPKPRYPAALNTRYPGEFREMIGVGSTTCANTYADDPSLRVLVEGIPPKLRGPFSNYGPWVTCSDEGALVLSTFLNVNMKTEDPPSRTTNFANAHALWSGTSFAAPKIVARIVKVMGDRQLTALQAWKWILDNDVVTKTSNLGYTFA